MSSLFEKLKKRRAYPVQNLDGVFVRLLTQGEKTHVATFEDQDQRGYFLLGKILCNEDGSQDLTQAEGEKDLEFAERVRVSMVDVDDGTISDIVDTYQKLTRGERIPIETIIKN